jgi:putative transposase
MADAMATYTQILYHIVFSTKNRERSLTADRREDLFRYIWGIIKNNQSHLYRINGVEDHLHILTSVHPSVCLADLVKDIKTGSSKWIKESSVFPQFTHWQDGYAAFTHSIADKDRLIEYIRNQEEHHRARPFTEELLRLIQEAGIEFDPKYLT